MSPLRYVKVTGALSVRFTEGTMNPINQIQTESFRSVAEVIAHLQHESHNEIVGFRGHRRSSWHLETTFSRFVKQTMSMGIHGGRKREEVTPILLSKLEKHFRENLIINADLTENELSGIDIWQYGQHHGIPSPLLDWTESPFVALFFALCEPEEDGSAPDRCIWVLNVQLLEIINGMIREEVWPKLSKKLQSQSLLEQQFPQVEVLRQVTSANRRMSYQRAFFTKHEFYESFEVWLDRVMPELAHAGVDTFLLKKLEFSCSHQERIEGLRQLEKMNINFRTLFPDVFGSASSAKLSAQQSLLQPSQHTFNFSRV